MLPSTFVIDSETQKCEIFFEQDLLAFLQSKKQNGIDIDSRYTVYSFDITNSFKSNETIDLILRDEFLVSEDE